MLSSPITLTALRVEACSCAEEGRIPGCLMCAACEARLDAHDAPNRAVEAAYEKRAETFGTPEWSARFDAEKRALAEWR